jgi:hypothetical protein
MQRLCPPTTALTNKPGKTTPFMRRVIIYAVLLLVVFLLGFVPMWLKSRECSSSLSKAEHQLNLARIQNALASAAIDARRGDYELARQAASNFFLRHYESNSSHQGGEQHETDQEPRNALAGHLAHRDRPAARGQHPNCSLRYHTGSARYRCWCFNPAWPVSRSVSPFAVLMSAWNRPIAL